MQLKHQRPTREVTAWESHQQPIKDVEFFLKLSSCSPPGSTQQVTWPECLVWQNLWSGCQDWCNLSMWWLRSLHREPQWWTISCGIWTCKTSSFKPCCSTIQWFPIFFLRDPNFYHCQVSRSHLQHTLYKKKKKLKEPRTTLYVKQSFFVIFCQDEFLFSEDEVFGFTHRLGVFGRLAPLQYAQFQTFIRQFFHHKRCFQISFCQFLLWSHIRCNSLGTRFLRFYQFILQFHLGY